MAIPHHVAANNTNNTWAKPPAVGSEFCWEGTVDKDTHDDQNLPCVCALWNYHAQKTILGGNRWRYIRKMTIKKNIVYTIKNNGPV